MLLNFKMTIYRMLIIPPLIRLAYSFECTFFRSIYLMAKALRRITMRSFLIGVTKPKKRTLKRVQLRNPG
jgi:hypothetical protein